MNKSIKKQIEKDLFYEYHKIFSSLSLADVTNWNRVVNLLVASTIDVINEHNALMELKNNGLNSKKSTEQKEDF